MHISYILFLLLDMLTIYSISIYQFLFQNYLKLAGADDGIEEIRASGMVLRCFQTRTGIKFVITSEPNTSMIIDLEAVLREIYVLYTECVLKDPFYELEMPIRSELFVQAVDSLIDKVERMASTSTAMKLTR
jgi:Sybindin-like family